MLSNKSLKSTVYACSSPLHQLKTEVSRCTKQRTHKVSHFSTTLFKKDWTTSFLCKKTRNFSFHSTELKLSQWLSTAIIPESGLRCCFFWTVRCQSTQCDGKYIGPLHPCYSHESARPRFVHSGRATGSVWLGPHVALCRSSNFLCWPSPDSEKCWAGWSFDAPPNKGSFQYTFIVMHSYISW